MTDKMLFCFDVDGTLTNQKMIGDKFTYAGIIPTHVLVYLISYGHRVAIVSPSPYFPEGFESMVYAKNGSNDYRWENIENAMVANNILDKNSVVYVDDLKANRDKIKTWGVREVYSPEEFMVDYIQW